MAATDYEALLPWRIGTIVSLAVALCVNWRGFKGVLGRLHTNVRLRVSPRSISVR